MEQRAYFVYHPRRIYDLCVPHLPEQELAFEITAVKALEDRSFLDGILPPHSTIKQCILITRRNAADGILVEPDGRGFVLRAAYYSVP